MMKKLVAFSCVAALHFVGCGKESENVAPDSDSSTSTAEPSDEEFVFEVKMPRTEVPTIRTSYRCAQVEGPSGSVHAVSFGVYNENPDVLHHIVLYHMNQPWKKTPQDCLEYMPPFQGIVWIWAVGALPIRFPEHMGIVMGDESARKYLLMETHYDNPEQKVGIVDSSGLNVVMTRKLRPTNAGFFAVGTLPIKSALKIPAGTKTHTYAECMPSVSKSVLAEKMKVYAYGFHAHFIGKALWFDLWDSDLYSEEDGKPDEQWETIASDPYYDFDYQQIVPLTETFDMKPGDGIRVHCMYDNSNGSEDVYGGQGSNEEMCFVFFLYEPEEATAKIGCFDFREYSERELDPNVIPPRGRFAEVHSNRKLVDSIDSQRCQN